MKTITLSMLFSATVLAGLQLVPANFASVQGSKSSATASGGVTKNLGRGRCVAIALGYDEVKNNEAIAKSVAEVATYVCGDGPDDEKQEEAIAEATATAFALAITEASVTCEGEGNVNVHAKAYSKAVSRADLWLEAYANATAAAGDCGKCDAYTNSWGYVRKHVFLEAVAESNAKIDDYQNLSLGKFFTAVKDVNVDIQTATAKAFAAAVAGAKKYHDANECFAWVNAGGCIWTPPPADPDLCFFCEAETVGKSNITQIDALAEASAAALAYTCGTNTTAVAEAYVAASALAEAAAEALSYSYASCESGTGAYSCSFSAVQAEDTAIAVAEAFAESWALGYTCDDTCTVEVKTVVSTVGDILVKASTSALSELCAEEGEQWTSEALAESIEKVSLEALAEAIAYAVVGDECYAAAIADTVVQ